MTLNPNAKIPAFITKVQEPVHFLDINVLHRCVVGLNRRIRKAKSSHEKARLRIIKTEIRLLELNFSDL